MPPIIDPPDPTNLVQADTFDLCLQNYARGWSNIAKQIQIRLSALSLLGPVHRFIKWEKINPESREWLEQFSALRADGRQVVNSWIINGSTSPASKISPEDSNRWTRRTTVELHGVLEIEDPITWHLWHSMLRQIDDDLRNGDRTFGMTCLTHTLPEQTSSNVASFCGVDCHSCILNFVVEEAGIFPTTP